MAKRREIRNSTAEFLIFQIEGKEQGVEVYYKDKTVWCTQKAMGMLGYQCTARICHSWICAGQKAYGEWHVLG